jgi:parallel beta-helix repeat protein
MMLTLLLVSALVFAYMTLPARSSPGTITVPDDYLTIQAGINAASPGDTVYVRAGTYVENVVLNKTLSLVGEDAESTTIDGGGAGDVVLIVVDGVNLTGFTVCESGLTSSAGIRLRNASHCGISGNNIRSNCEGVRLEAGQSNTVSGNNITTNDLYAVVLSYSPYNFFSGNDIADNGHGVYVSFSYYNTFFGNSIKANGGYGIALEGCSSTMLSENIFVNDGLYVWGSYGSAVVDNLVNGKPLVYLESVSDSVVGDAGQVVLVNCHRIRVENLNLSATTMGVELWGTSNSKLTGNNFTNNLYGIYSEYSSNNTVSGNNMADNMAGVSLAYDFNDTISGNNVTANYWRGVSIWYSSNNTASVNNLTNNENGIFVESSSNNTVSGNKVANNRYGIQFKSSSDNTVSGNNIANNTFGVHLESASDNLFFHNDFITNSQQAFLSEPAYANVWDNGYPSGGNYWSDYSGTDQFRGISQNETGSDGIGDAPKPLFINSSQADFYPLMGPFGPLTTTGESVTVFPAENVGLIFENVAASGSTTVSETGAGPPPESGFKIEGQYLDVSTTASYSGSITIRVTYDDSHMTLQEEESLRLMHWNETTEQWENITTYVDMESNVIYGETNHLSIFGVHSVLIHDLSIFGVHAYKTCIGRGYTLRIDVDVMDEGDFAENFDATLDLTCGDVTILSIFGVHTGSQDTMTISFYWNTANNALGTYTITAHVPTVPYEINTANNDYTDGTVKVTIAGDVNGDGIVNIKDASIIGSNWGKHPLPPWPPWPPIIIFNADINGDGNINIMDATLVGLNWLKHA